MMNIGDFISRRDFIGVLLGAAVGTAAGAAYDHGQKHSGNNIEEITYTNFLKEAQSGNFTAIIIDGRKTICSDNSGKIFQATLPPEDSDENINLLELLSDTNTQISYVDEGVIEQLISEGEDHILRAGDGAILGAIAGATPTISSLAARYKNSVKYIRNRTEDDKRRIAYHEAGHALAAILKPGTDELKDASITIEPGFLGRVTFSEDLENTKTAYRNHLIMLLAGRAGEILFYNEMGREEDFTTSVKQDLDQAANLAWLMVHSNGMADFGPVSFTETPAYSEEKKGQLDEARERLLRNAEAQALELLREYRPAFDAIVEKLLEIEARTPKGLTFQFLRLFNPKLGMLTADEIRALPAVADAIKQQQGQSAPTEPVPRA